MSRCIGIVREVYSKWERRVPLCPKHVQKLVSNHGVRVLIQPSTRRIFGDDEFRAVGAEVTEDLTPANVILGVKQVPIQNLIPNKTFVFFSHTKKAQPANMPLLDKILEQNITLVDYECITQAGVAGAPRLIAFGSFAGNAGMINCFRGLGERLLALGYSTPFLNIGPCYSYPSLNAACDAVRAAGKRLSSELPTADAIAPLTFVFTGKGKVTQGALEVFNCLPHTMVDVNDLPDLHRDVLKSPQNSAARKQIYSAIATQKHMVKPKNASVGEDWSVGEYYENPQEFESVFASKVAPYTSVLVNCMYWDQRFPRLLTLDETAELQDCGRLRMLMNADLTCDIGGSVEFLTHSTHIEKPFYVYNPKTRKTSESLDDEGVVLLGVDILPSELPREASNHFGDILVNYLPQIAAHKAEESHEQLPRELAAACIASNGKLTPRYQYIQSMRQVSTDHKLATQHSHKIRPQAQRNPNTCVKTIMLKGHLFDSGFINQALDLLEARAVQFDVDEIDVTPNTSAHKNESSMVLTLQSVSAQYMDGVLADIRKLAKLTPTAQAKILDVNAPHASDAQSADKEAPAMTTDPAVRHVVVLGAGLVSQPLVNYLANTCARDVVLVSGSQAELAAAKDRFPSIHCRHMQISATETEALEKLISRAYVVVSLLPAPMHPSVARLCLKHNKHLVTASYVSDEMRSMSEEAASKGLVFLNEMGLDPGMDHMSAMKVIDTLQASGGRVVGFSSVCGGLPAPEAANNPLGYKFSWSPRGVLTASKNAARFLKDGAEVNIVGEQLLANAAPITVIPSLNLEVLPNRNSIPYAKTYRIDHTAKSVFRGTLRYNGFSSILFGIRQIGLMDDTPVAELSKENTQAITWSAVMKMLGMPSEDHVRAKLTAGPAAENTVNCLRWLGVFGEAPVEKRGNVMDSFCALLEKRLAYVPGERDMVVMQHVFDVEWDGQRRERHTSTLVGYGQPRGETAMAKTVGITTAIGAELILQSHVTTPGVILPITPEIYGPTLALMEKEGFGFTEEFVRL